MSRAATAGPARIPTDLQAALVLVRHGESTFVAEGRFQGRQDPPLSPLGERQAAATADWLATPGGPPGMGVSSLPLEIVHSPLTRAARSAEVIAVALAGPAAVGPALRAEPALAEISQGEWEGLTHAEVASRWGDLLATWMRSPLEVSAPGGEPLVQADWRVRGIIPGLLDPLRAASARPMAEVGRAWSIVVAHDGILRVLLLALLGIPLDRFWAFPFALGGVSVVDLAGGRASLRAHNLAGLVTASADRPAAGALPDRGGAL